MQLLQAQIYVNKEDLYGSVPYYEFIPRLLLVNGIRGATVFKAWLGFGRNQHLNTPNNLFSFDETNMMITFADEPEKAKAALTALRAVISNAFIITHLVEEWP